MLEFLADLLTPIPLYTSLWVSQLVKLFLATSCLPSPSPTGSASGECFLYFRDFRFPDADRLRKVKRR